MNYSHGQHGLYRSRRGLIFGVCRGLADYMNVPAFWMRVLALLVLVFTGFWPVVGIYLVAALLMKAEPSLVLCREEAGGCRGVYDHQESLDRRLQRLEGSVTDKERDWERRLYQG